MDRLLLEWLLATPRGVRLAVWVSQLEAGFLIERHRREQMEQTPNKNTCSNA